MSIYYITTNAGVVYELDSTTEISFKGSGKVTDNFVESGDSVVDHYVNNPVVFEFKGSISDVKSLGSSNPNSKNTEDYIKGLFRLKENKEAFSFQFGEKIGSYSDCLFETLDITQNQRRGNIGEIDSFSVRAVIKQIRIAERARVVPARDLGIVDEYQEEQKGAATTEEPSEPEGDALDRALREREDILERKATLLTGG